MASISRALFTLISFLAGMRFLAKDKLLEVFILFQNSLLLFVDYSANMSWVLPL